MNTCDLKEITKELTLALSEVRRLSEELNIAVVTIETIRQEVAALDSKSFNLEQSINLFECHLESIECQLDDLTPYDY